MYICTYVQYVQYVQYIYNVLYKHLVCDVRVYHETYVCTLYCNLNVFKRSSSSAPLFEHTTGSVYCTQVLQILVR